MKNRAWVAAAIALSSLTAQAAVNTYVRLEEGINEFPVTFTEPPEGTYGSFSEAVAFDLPSSSQVSVWITGFSDDVLALALSVRRFNGTHVITPKAVIQGSSVFFDLGTLQVPTGLTAGFGPYSLHMAGFAAPTATGVNLRMQVTAVPEASTWAMLAVGLAGVALVSRARRVSQA